MKTKTRKTRGCPIMFYMTEDERNAIVEAAEMEDMTISEFCRKTLLIKASLIVRAHIPSCKSENNDV